MHNKKKLLFILLLIITTLLFSGCFENPEQIKTIMAKYLYEKYGEEFAIDRLGTRSAVGKKFYQARIYPKSIMGTLRENDQYYYGSASINIESFGRLNKKVGDDYSYINRNDDVENYLLPKAKELFGNRIRLKVDVAHKITGDGSWWAGYKSISLKEMRKAVKENPEKNRIELNLYIYIFDRIDSDEEKEERRKQIFKYIQYLKQEGLFEYLEMGVIFIDERVLAPSYTKYKNIIDSTETVKEIVEGEEVYLPPKELRKEMSQVLEKEVDKMNEEEKIESMKRILKSKLDSNSNYLKYFKQYLYQIISMKYLKEIDKYGRYEEAKKDNTVNEHYYKTIDSIESGWFREYISNTLKK